MHIFIYHSIRRQTTKGWGSAPLKSSPFFLRISDSIDIPWSFFEHFLGPIDYTASVFSSQRSQSIPSATLKVTHNELQSLQGADQNLVPQNGWSLEWVLSHGSPTHQGYMNHFQSKNWAINPSSDHGTSISHILANYTLVISCYIRLISHRSPNCVA